MFSEDGRGPDVCDESSLGSVDRMSDQEKTYRQTERTVFPGSDAELEHDLNPG